MQFYSYDCRRDTEFETDKFLGFIFAVLLEYHLMGQIKVNYRQDCRKAAICRYCFYSV